MEATSAYDLVPQRRSIGSLRDAAATCRACELWRKGTQTVFGEGRAGADIMLVGEQPGDREDKEGKPFVGPAGRVLSEALEEAGIPTDRAYVTNVVKHFNWEPKGKRRIHRTPRAPHIEACRPWLEAELEVVKPDVLVALGATAAKALLGRAFKLTQQRGTFVDSDLAPLVTATVHPSSILRQQSDEDRHLAMKAFVHDFRLIAARLP